MGGRTPEGGSGAGPSPGPGQSPGWTSRPVGVHVQRPRGTSTSRQSPVGLQCDSGSIVVPPRSPGPQVTETDVPYSLGMGSGLASENFVRGWAAVWKCH